MTSIDVRSSLMTKDEALQLIAEKECTTAICKEFMRQEPRTCREVWPAEISEWCPSCIAKEVSE
jgi:hypothetical protein